MLHHLRAQVSAYAEKLEHATIRAERAEANALENRALFDVNRDQGRGGVMSH